MILFKLNWVIQPCSFSKLSVNKTAVSKLYYLDRVRLCSLDKRFSTLLAHISSCACPECLLWSTSLNKTKSQKNCLHMLLTGINVRTQCDWLSPWINIALIYECVEMQISELKMPYNPVLQTRRQYSSHLSERLRWLTPNPDVLFVCECIKYAFN